jgi:hypothetical protein
VDAAEDLERDHEHEVSTLLTDGTDLEAELAEESATHAKVVTELDRLDSEAAENQAGLARPAPASAATAAFEGQKARVQSLRERDASAEARLEEMRAFEQSLKPLIDSHLVRTTTRGGRLVVALPKTPLLGTSRPPRVTTSATSGVLADVVRALREHGWKATPHRPCYLRVGFTAIAYCEPAAADATRKAAAADAAAIADALALLGLTKPLNTGRELPKPNLETRTLAAPGSMTDSIEIVVEVYGGWCPVAA